MIQAFRFIEISKYDDGGQLMTTANLCLEAVDLRHSVKLQLGENRGFMLKMLQNISYKFYILHGTN